MAPSTAEFEFDRWEFKTNRCTDGSLNQLKITFIEIKRYSTEGIGMIRADKRDKYRNGRVDSHIEHYNAIEDEI